MQQQIFYNNRIAFGGEIFDNEDTASRELFRKVFCRQGNNDKINDYIIRPYDADAVYNRPRKNHNKKNR